MIVFGVSHSKALYSAAKSVGVTCRFFNAKAHVTKGGDGVARLSDAFLSAADGGGRIVSMVGGNSHNHFGLLDSGNVWDFISPGEKRRIPRGVNLISYSAVIDVLQNSVRSHLNILKVLATTFPGRVIHIESPPQIGDNEYIAKSRLRAADITGRKSFRRTRIASPDRRRRLWLLHSDIYRDACSKFGAGFISVPAESMDSDGFLLPEYWENSTHANEAYGALVLKQLEGAA
jgi:hypothetical protein